MKIYSLFLVILFVLLGCAKPLPSERVNYAGVWQGDGMTLNISAGGEVSYERVNGNVTTSVNGPIKEFVGDDFVVGFLFISTTFDVSEPPHEVDGYWTMTVDEVPLIRTQL